MKELAFLRWRHFIRLKTVEPAAIILIDVQRADAPQYIKRGASVRVQRWCSKIFPLDVDFLRLRLVVGKWTARHVGWFSLEVALG